MVVPTVERSRAEPESQIPVVETVNTALSVQQAQDLAKKRLIRYQSVIEANKNHPTDHRFYTEERVTLRDGGEVISAGTPEGRVYYLSNNDQWMFLERSTDERIQTLLICENTGHGQKFTQKFTSR
ncbi:hypothetical protein Y032_0718g1804 [Ancylostoma ceylanicum]|uniref:Uncharacterized protein n=1 Tax=Ancylostoma ceylanicum TaxID=53326 RepID=A0A016WFM8_9BILA|nr:hypothetical protein Y032_0718g1804 [Ancylostoma ceylanicum]